MAGFHEDEDSLVAGRGVIGPAAVADPEQRKPLTGSVRRAFSFGLPIRRH
jgi:hypothetical protein